MSFCRSVKPVDQGRRVEQSCISKKGVLPGAYGCGAVESIVHDQRVTGPVLESLPSLGFNLLKQLYVFKQAGMSGGAVLYCCTFWGTKMLRQLVEGSAKKLPS